MKLEPPGARSQPDPFYDRLRDVKQGFHELMQGDQAEAGSNDTAMAHGTPINQQRRAVESEFLIDQDGNPRGGWAGGEGFHIGWQNGVKERTGAFLEEVIEACIQRLRFFQASKFACEENDMAITHLQGALAQMALRQRRREERGVEGSYAP